MARDRGAAPAGSLLSARLATGDADAARIACEEEAALALALGGPALGEDWMSVAPKGRKVLLDSPTVRVIEMTLGPGQKEPVHTHPANFAYLMGSGKVRVSYVGGETAEPDGRTGQVLWSGPEAPPTLENLSKKTPKALVVELKEHPYVPPGK